MTHEEDRLIGTLTDEGRNRPIRVGLAFDGIVKSRQPKPSGIALKGNAAFLRTTMPLAVSASVTA